MALSGNSNSAFIQGFIQDGYIKNAQGTIVGVSISTYEAVQNQLNEAVELLTTYKDKLIELGVIKKEMTVEERQEAIEGRLDTLLNALEGVSNRLSRLEENINGVTTKGTFSAADNPLYRRKD